MDKLNSSKKIDTETLIKQDLEHQPVEKIKPNWFARKSKKIKSLAGDFWVKGKTGFLFGGAVGATMGFLGGCASAYQTKSLIVIPVSMIGSSVFFASLMAIGACLRSEDVIYDENNQVVGYYAYIENINKEKVLVNTKLYQNNKL